MNREILFKAKRKDNNEYVEGSLLILESGYYIVPTGTYYNLMYDEAIKEALNCIWEEQDFFEVIPETVSQYTGLKDKNGVKIFENDIIQVFNTIGEVSEKLTIKWDSNMGTYEILTLNNYHYSYDTKCAIVGCEVIGNIFDNPELLDKEVK